VGKFQVIELIQKEIVKNANAVRKEPWKKTRLYYINQGLEIAIELIEEEHSKISVKARTNKERRWWSALRKEWIG